MKTNPIPKELEALANQIGELTEHWGFKKIHGEIWTHVWLAKEPIDATTLVKRLDCSKALVSLALRDLVKHNVIRVVGRGNRRKLLLEANSEIRTVIANIVMNREALMLESVMNQFKKTTSLNEKAKKELGLDDEKMNSLQMMISVAQLSLAAIVDTHLR